MSTFTRSITRTNTRRAGSALALAAVTVGGAMTTAPASSAASSPAPSSTAAHGVQPRTAIPWKSVTKGWIVVQVTKNGHDNLVMVAPGGQSYQITTIDGSHLAGVSPDGKRALLSDEHGIAALDLASGRRTSLPGLEGVTTFSKPNGLAVIGTDAVGHLLNRSATTGALTRTGAQVGLGLWRILPTPDGRSDIVSTAETVRLYDHATLQPRRTYGAPKGFAQCQPLTFTDASHFRETCTTRASLATGVGESSTTQVFTQAISGGAPVAVTSGTYPGGNAGKDEGRLPLGFSSAWNTAKGTIAAPNLAFVTGSTRLFRMAGTKVAQTYSVPMAADAAKMTPMVQTMVGTSAYYTSNLHEPGPSLALRYDVATNTVTYLAGAHSQYGGTVADFAVVE